MTDSTSLNAPIPPASNDDFGKIQNFTELSTGGGATIGKINKEGWFIGGTNYTDAPFSVNYSGTFKATDATITGVINATSGRLGSATNYWSIGANGITATSASADVIINYGKTDFTNTQTGFILGYDYSATKAKFYIGNTTEYFNWDGTNMVMAGTINATGGTFSGTISGGSFIGGTFKTVEPGAATGSAVVITGGNNKGISFYYNTASVATITGINVNDDDGELETLRVVNDLGNGFRFRQSNIGCTIDLVPTGTTETLNLGNGGHKWNNLYGNTCRCNSYYGGAGSGALGVSKTVSSVSHLKVAGGIVTELDA